MADGSLQTSRGLLVLVAELLMGGWAALHMVSWRALLMNPNAKRPPPPPPPLPQVGDNLDVLQDAVESIIGAFILPARVRGVRGSWQGRPPLPGHAC